MALLDNVLAALREWDLWKRIELAPDRVDDLDRRVSAMEEKLGGKWPADVCKFCGERAVRRTGTYGPTAGGVITEYWTCGECGARDPRPMRVR